MTWTWTSGEAARLWRILGDGDCLLLDLTAENHWGYDPLPGRIPVLLDHLASTSAVAGLLAWQGIHLCWVVVAMKSWIESLAELSYFGFARVYFGSD